MMFEKSDLDFFKDLGMSKVTFTFMLQKIEPLFDCCESKEYHAVEPKNVLVMTLWYLATKFSFRELGAIFGV